MALRISFQEIGLTTQRMPLIESKPALDVLQFIADF